MAAASKRKPCIFIVVLKLEPNEASQQITLSTSAADCSITAASVSCLARVTFSPVMVASRTATTGRAVM
jgi:hypothetical protein